MTRHESGRKGGTTRSTRCQHRRHAQGVCKGCPSRTYKGRWYCWQCRRFRAMQARWRALDAAAVFARRAA